MFKAIFILKWDRHNQKIYYLCEEFNYQNFFRKVLEIITFSIDDKRPTWTLAFVCLTIET